MLLCCCSLIAVLGPVLIISMIEIANCITTRIFLRDALEAPPLWPPLLLLLLLQSLLVLLLPLLPLVLLLLLPPPPP